MKNICERSLMIIMLKLVNIKRTSEYIEADYIPEVSEEIGHIKVGIKSNNLIEKKITSFDEGYSVPYYIMAKQGIVRLKDDEPLPEEYRVMWY